MAGAAAKRPHRGSVLLGLIALAAVGCGSSDNVEVFPVSGTVTYDGKPMVGGGAIAFVPTGGQKGKTAGGSIKEDGTYVMSTYGDGDGSMPGEFRVVITQVVHQEPDYGGDSDAGGGAVQEPINVVAENDRIPAIYADRTNSPLTATVEEKDNTIDFTLNRQ